MRSDFSLNTYAECANKMSNGLGWVNRIISGRNSPLCSTLTYLHQSSCRDTKQKQNKNITYNNNSAIDPYTIMAISLEYKKRYNIVVVVVVIPYAVCVGTYLSIHC